MTDNSIYSDISKRTGGDIYIGVVGPVRTGKSTFIHKFLDNVVIPNIENEYDKQRTLDEMPQSASGRTIMTTEPKFVPDDSVRVTLDEDIEFRVKMVDCVGYLVDGAIGAEEDGENRMVGIVTVDDAMDVLQEEATEDIEKMTAITPSERSYTRTGVLELVKNRIPWLMLLMLSATFTGMIITSFESALAAQAALTAFIPMLMSTAGNSGSQSSVTVLRSMSLGELEFSDIFKVLYKELRVAVLCAAALACVNFAKMYLVDFLLLGNSGLTVPVMAVVCLTLGATVVFAKLVGCTLPMLAKKIGLDPAVMASPFITTIVDTVTLLVYFRFASAILNI